MAAKGGFWKKVAGAFVEFDDRGAPAAATPSDLDAQLKEAQDLVASLDQKPSPAAAAAPPPPRPPPTPGAAGSTPEVPEGAAFTDLYAQAGVPAVHHTAEQMLSILDGLSAMPREACLMAVNAMDAADDRWTVADVLADANAKTDALGRAVAALNQQLAGAEERARAAHAEADQLLAQAEAAIREQIAQLEAELATFRQGAAAKKAEADASLQATRDAVARESARLQSEAFRLGRVRAFFEVPPPLPKPR